jgi:hypothetical protein
VLARSRGWERYPKCSGSTVPHAIERKRLSIESTGMTGKGDEAATTDGLQYPMVDLFTWRHNAAADVREPTTADLCNLNHVTEVAREFIVRR